jgi:hypothetical protein
LAETLDEIRKRVSKQLAVKDTVRVTMPTVIAVVDGQNVVTPKYASEFTRVSGEHYFVAGGDFLVDVNLSQKDAAALKDKGYKDIDFGD